MVRACSPLNPPSISETDRTVIKPGMVLGIEPFTSRGNLPIIWEDVYAMGGSENERLTQETHALREIT